MKHVRLLALLLLMGCHHYIVIIDIGVNKTAAVEGEVTPEVYCMIYADKPEKLTKEQKKICAKLAEHEKPKP